MDDSAEGKYYIILGRDLLIELGLGLKCPKRNIGAGDGPLKGSTSPMIDLGTYKFKYVSTRKIRPGEYFMNNYIEELYES